MAHIAMFEAVNSIEPRYTPYSARLPAERSWSQEAAASAAAHGVLSKLVANPERVKEFDALHNAVLARIPDGPAKTGGLELGARAAAAVIAERAGDGSDAVNDYRPVTAPGVYVPTQFPTAIIPPSPGRSAPCRARRTGRPGWLATHDATAFVAAPPSHPRGGGRRCHGRCSIHARLHAGPRATSLAALCYPLARAVNMYL